MALYTTVTSYPPLGELSVVPANQNYIQFIVLIEWSRALPQCPWEVCVCYKDATRQLQGQKWTEVKLNTSSAKPLVVAQETPQSYAISSNHLSTHTGMIDCDLRSLQRISFTVKYRGDSLSRWTWVEQQFGTMNGECIIQEPLSGAGLVSSFLNIDSSWSVRSTTKDSANATSFLLELQSENKSTADRDFSRKNVILGQIIGLRRSFSIVQILEYWFAPRHSRENFHIEEDGIMCCFLISKGHFVTLLGLSGLNHVQVLFQSTEDHRVSVSTRNDYGVDAPVWVVASTATSLEGSIASAMSAARKIYTEADTAALPKQINTPKVQNITIESHKSNYNLDNWYNGLAYCTWNSLGPNLTLERILSGLESLVRNGVYVSTIIIDDNWMTQDKGSSTILMHQSMMEFEADRTSFPDGLAETIRQIRQKHPYLKNVAVWHPLLGYWGGFSPRGTLGKRYRMIEVEAQLMVGHTTKSIHLIHPDDVSRYYDEFYAFLSSCGVTGVKTDVQFQIAEVSSGTDRGNLLSTYPPAWTAAYLKHFEGRAISCMSMTPQNLLRSFLPTSEPKIMLRNSDDFYPEVMTSHAWHLFINAHNALFTKHLNVLPDWDMFQTLHPFSSYHAAARCISGGPIYITDSPGEHDVHLIEEMTAIGPNKERIILRPTTLGRSMNPWDNFADGHILKIGSFTGTDEHGTAILGLFNISEKAVSEIISLNDFPLAIDEQPAMTKSRGAVLIRSYRNADILAVIDSKSLLSPESLIYTALPVRGFDILNAHSVQKLSYKSTAVSFAILGLLYKMSGPAALSFCSVDVLNEVQIKTCIKLKALGILGIWVSASESRFLPRIMEARLQGRLLEGYDLQDVIVGAKQVGKSARVIELDLEKGWNSLGIAWGTFQNVEIELLWE